MNESCKIKQLKENLEIRNKLNRLGIYGIIGSTGPQGKQGAGINIKYCYNSLAKLKTDHPIGNEGDAYVINGDLYVWDTRTSSWENVGKIQEPTGVKGDPGGIGVYAERYMRTRQTLNLVADVENTLPLDNTGPILNARYTPNNAITIDEAGIYKIDYFITIESPTDVIFTLAVKKDQDIITGSDVNGDGITDYYTQLSGTIITQLLPEEVITLMLKASKTVNISFNGSTNAKINIIKLSQIIQYIVN